MSKSIIVLLLIIFIASPVAAADGVIDIPSSFDVSETADRIEKMLKEKGMTIFNRIKHSESAAKVDITLRDTELIIFGNPKVGSPLMECQQSVAIDLPQKALIWKDERSKVWISYNDPRYLEERHTISGCEEILAKIGKVLSGIVKAASTNSAD